MIRGIFKGGRSKCMGRCSRMYNRCRDSLSIFSNIINNSR